MPWRRHNSVTFAPPSASLKMPMICSSLNRARFMPAFLPGRHLYVVHSPRRKRINVDRRSSGGGRRADTEAKSSKVRLAPSPGVQLSSDGIPRRECSRSPRMCKCEREHLGRDSRTTASKGQLMLVVGIDVGAEVHHVAVVDEAEVAIVKPTAFTEELGGYEKLLEMLARAENSADLSTNERRRHILVVMEATGPLLAKFVHGASGAWLCG